MQHFVIIFEATSSSYTLLNGTRYTAMVAIVFVHNHEVKRESCCSLTSVPVVLTPDTLNKLLSHIDCLDVCAGHPDNNYVTMVVAKKGVLKSCDGNVAAALDDYAPVMLDGCLYEKTIRHSTCEVLIQNGGKCTSCKNYRAVLRKIYSQWSSRQSDQISHTTSNTNERYMNTPEKRAKLDKMKKRVLVAENEVRKLQQKVKQLTQERGENIDKDVHGELLSIMQEKTNDILQAYPEGTFARLFWEEQLRAATAKDPRQVRWHPLIIRWCLNLKLLSSSAYHATHTAGFIKLPSERTLRDYTHYFQSRPGFQLEVNQQLIKEGKLDKLPEHRKYCSLILDEMKIKENLVYNKYSGEVIGFTNLGNINDELLCLERECNDDT